jgi:broad specificity phosphatase PhoE
MNKHLILVKHSVPEIQEDLPANMWKLSEEGRLRARRLAAQLESFAPEIVVSSNEPKAKETAEIVANQLQLSMQIVPGLQEHDRSNVPYLLHDAFQLLFMTSFKSPLSLCLGGKQRMKPMDGFIVPCTRF